VKAEHIEGEESILEGEPVRDADADGLISHAGPEFILGFHRGRLNLAPGFYALERRMAGKILQAEPDGASEEQQAYEDNKGQADDCKSILAKTIGLQHQRIEILLQALRPNGSSYVIKDVSGE